MHPLTTTADQTLPPTLGKRSPTSEVFDFAFDFNLNRTRRDTDNTKIRIDYSNVRGYWDAVVDSPGIQSDGSNRLGKRFFAPQVEQWRSMYQDSYDDMNYDGGDTETIKKNLDAPLFWQSVDECHILGEEYEQGFAAHVEGDMNAEFTYGFSMVVRLFSFCPRHPISPRKRHMLTRKTTIGRHQ